MSFKHNLTDRASVSCLSPVLSASVTGGQSASLFSVGNATASLSAARIAQAVSYGSLNLTVSGSPELLEVLSTGTLTLNGSADVARVATFGDYSSSSSLTVEQLPFLWVLGDLAGSVTADQVTGVRVFGDLTGTVIETGVPITYTPPTPPSYGYYYGMDEDGGMLFYSYTLVTPLEFGGTGASGVQVMHDITSSGTVTLVSPYAVTAGGTITGSVTAITTRAGDRSSFQEQPEIPFPEVGEIIADIRESSKSLTDLHDQLVAAGASLVQATAAALSDLSNTLASAQAQVTTEQLDAGGPGWDNRGA